VFDVPLLVETGFHREVDRVVVITSKETQQIERLKKRAGMSEEETRRIISSQMDLEEKVKAADFVIRNEGSIETTRRRVREVFQELRRIALQKRRRSTDK
jgi:dephospho-CoA kinase